MKDKTTVLNLLNKFSSMHDNISWKMKCSYSDGRGTSVNEIKIIKFPENRSLGIISYQIETGLVMHCSYKNLKKETSGHIVDLLLDMINHSK
jgi:hypothetical protein